MSAQARVTARELVDDLAAIRRKRRMSQAVVARKIGISQSGVSSFESHRAEPLLSTLLRYAHAVGADITFEVRQ
ncbi:hypothetical protein B1R94_02195 [Mycolicibacterium litorale]|nr:hypothetical protein B1R94_02195 [Mycolicibacterium litorale]